MSQRETALSFPRPGIRKAFPESYPNFRDEGVCTHRTLLKLTQKLQKQSGWCYASEGGKRQMLGEDTGLAAGVGTIPGAEDALEARGIMVIRRAMPHSTMPDGSECKDGTRLTKVLTNARERMLAREDYDRRLALRRKSEPNAECPRRVVNEPLQRMPVERLLASVRRPANPSRPRPLFPHEKDARQQEDSAANIEAKRRESLEQLAILQQQWSAEERGEPPKGDAG